MTTLPAAAIAARTLDARRRILCVDDDPEITRIIELILSNYDVDVIRDCCGQQGIWDAIQAKPDLIITDLQMQHGDGEDLLACVRGNAQTSHIPIIVLTGRRGSHVAGRMRRLGAAGFLTKPFAHHELLAVIRGLIELPEHRWARVDDRGLRLK